MDLTDSESIHDKLEDSEQEQSENQTENQIYEKINSRLDQMYRAARNGESYKVNRYQEELSQIYDKMDSLDVEKII